MNERHVCGRFGGRVQTVVMMSGLVLRGVKDKTLTRRV